MIALNLCSLRVSAFTKHTNPTFAGKTRKQKRSLHTRVLLEIILILLAIDVSLDVEI